MGKGSVSLTYTSILIKLDCFTCERTDMIASVSYCLALPISTSGSYQKKHDEEREVRERVSRSLYF